MQSDSRWLVFAGAGASKAVDAEAFPTTVEFFERLPEDILSHPDFNLVVSYLKQAQAGRIIDIEEVLWHLQTLARFYSDVRRGNGIIGHSLAGNLAAKLIDRQWNFGQLPQVCERRGTAINAIISRINEIVFDLYSTEPDEEKLRDNWTYLIDRLASLEGGSVDYFTTNYDINIETALEYYDGTNVDALLGLKGKRHKMLNIAAWQSSSENPRGLLTKLHGSVDWKIKDDDVYLGDSLFTGDHSKQGIIYPGFKGSSTSVFFKPFHDYFERRLGEAVAVIFVGFAFRDEYINESIRNNLPDGTPVIVINPDRDVKFPYRRARVSYVHDFFDSKSIAMGLRNLLKGRRLAAV